MSLDLTINRHTTFGPLQITCKDANGTVVPLAGCTAYSECRKSPNCDAIINFAPIIEADDADGLITIPAISPATSKNFPSCSAMWDLILQLPDGSRLPNPIVSGRVYINLPITQPS